MWERTAINRAANRFIPTRLSGDGKGRASAGEGQLCASNGGSNVRKRLIVMRRIRKAEKLAQMSAEKLK